MVFSIFTKLCNYHHHIISKHFQPHFYPKEKPSPISCHSSFPSPWQPLLFCPSLWICLFWTFHISGIIQCVVSLDWLLSLNKFSRFIYVAAWFFTFLWLNNILLNRYTTFLIHSSIDGHVGCFYFLSIMNNAAMHIHVQIFVWHVFSIFLDIYLGLELLSHIITLCLLFLRKYQTVFWSCCMILHSQQQFLYILTNTCQSVFYFSHSSGMKCFWFAFP